MHSNILGPMRAAPGPVRTEPIQFVLHAAAPLLGAGGAARESGVAGEDKGLATLVAAPFLSGQPPPAPTRRDTTRPVTTRPELIDFARAVQSRTLRILGYKRRRGRSHAPTPA